MKKNVSAVSIILIGFAWCFINTRHYEEKNPPPPPPIKPPIELKLGRYIKDPYIAEVISKSKYPYLLAAIAKVESDYRPQVKGDKGESHGLYQIQAKHHGAFDYSIEGQTRKAEQIVGGLIKKKGFRKGVQAYNGRGPKSRIYLAKVLKAMAEIKQA